MRYLRKWTLPNGTVVHRYEDFEYPRGYGKSLFWYCAHCGDKYASMELFGEEENEEPYNPPWQAVSGLCTLCPPNRFSINGTLESAYTIGWPVPIEVAHYQLGQELAFLDNPNHPHNKESM